MPSIEDSTSYPLYTTAKAFSPFTGVSITPDFVGEQETIAVSLTQANPYPPTSILGSITDPTGVGNSYQNGFSETIRADDLSAFNTLIHRLVYTPPKLEDGQATGVNATITVNGYSYVYPYYATSSGVLDTVTPPQITGIVANQPETSGTIKPFATVSITDNDFAYNTQDTANITVVGGGTLSGDGLSKGSNGTYTLSTVPSWTLVNELHNLTLTVPDFIGTRTTSLALTVLDVPPSGAKPAPGVDPSTLHSTATASVLETGSKPLTASLTGTAHEGQVLTGTSDDPTATFQWQRSSDGGATWTDIDKATGGTYTPGKTDEGNLLRVAAHANGVADSTASAKVIDRTAHLTVSVSGNAEEGQVLLATPNLTDSDDTANAVTYQWQRSVDAGKTWDNIAGATANNYKLTAADDNDVIRMSASYTNHTGQTATGNSPASVAVAPPVTLPLPPPPSPPATITPNFHMADMTMGGAAYDETGDHYVGPVGGLDWQYIVPQEIVTHNINVTGMTKNAFIHTGSGMDAIDVSAVSGNNVLDGSTGSNFLVGGSGNDTFFLDNRAPGSDLWSTLVGFHSGDAATVWGVTKADFNLSWVDGQGAVDHTGLTMHATADGHPTASLTMAGFTTADLNDGRLSMSFGHTGDLPGLPGSDYMQIVAQG